MKFFVRGSIGICLAVSGCGSVPKLQTDIGLLRISDIVDNIRCELQEGRDGNTKTGVGPASFLTEKEEWNAGVDLSLNVIAEGGGNGAAGNDVPYIPQTATLALSTDVTGTADRQVGYKFTIGLGKRDQIDCNHDAVEARRSHGIRLVGDLGIASWLAQLQDAYAETRTKPESVAYTLSFKLVQKGEASVKIVKIPFDTAQASLGFGWKGSWTDTNKIIITFAPKPAKTPKKEAERPKRATKLPEGQKPRTVVPPPPPPVDEGSKERLLRDLDFLILQQKLQQ
ncbi:hypothetical protein ACFSOZ_11655 [Mesorhizobium newzealandense]|uniref:Lipoprotein n=1 Tax=Mesorhizobium newzealandense TaxID=1300302 RepID=A0ABW4U9R9_9HYPH